MIYIVSAVVFGAIVFALVGMLVFVENKLVQKGDRKIVINDDPDRSIIAPTGTSLLTALVTNEIYLPSACGGGGSCGMCRCRIYEGGRDVLPTEKTHLNRLEIKENVRLACQVKIKEDMRIEVPEEIFNIRKYTAEVVSNQNVATFIKELTLRLESEDRMKFKAGAYIQIDIPEHDIKFSEFVIGPQFRPVWDKFNLWNLQSKIRSPVFRAYSLANSPLDDRELKFTIRIATPPPQVAGAPPGAGSTYVFNLKEGDRVTLSGPYGDFRVKESDREMCFIGGGAGMAPLRSQIRDMLLRVGTSRKMTFWYGARSKQELFYDDEFTALDERFDNFSFYVALSDPLPVDDWHGMTGFIHQCLYDHYLKDHDSPDEVEYYLCGPPPMIDAVLHMLDNLGVEPEMIAYDKF